MKEARERPSAKSYEGGGWEAWGKNEARGRRQEPRANKRPSAKSYEGGGGKQGTKDKKRPKEKEARWKNVETASPTTILPMRTSEKKGKKNNNQCK